MQTRIAFENGCLRVQGELTIQHCAGLMAALFTALPGSGSALELDLSGVTELDTAGLQLLLAMRKEARCQLRIIEASPEVRKVMQLCHLQAWVAGTSKRTAS